MIFNPLELVKSVYVFKKKNECVSMTSDLLSSQERNSWSACKTEFKICFTLFTNWFIQPIFISFENIQNTVQGGDEKINKVLWCKNYYRTEYVLGLHPWFLAKSSHNPWNFFTGMRWAYFIIHNKPISNLSGRIGAGCQRNQPLTTGKGKGW